MGKPKPPSPPDPQETSQAQTGTNVSTSIANNVMRAMDMHGPTGSLTYHVRTPQGLVPLSQFRPPVGGGQGGPGPGPGPGPVDGGPPMPPPRSVNEDPRTRLDRMDEIAHALIQRRR